MRFHPKSLAEQVMVITGASSGIGLATARLAALAGARLVLAARNEQALRRICDEIAAGGGEAASVSADVADPADVLRVATLAVERFGGVDTWVNNAGISIFGPILDTPLDEQRRLFETNYWGVVHGSLIAVEQMRERGGVLINMGSAVSDRAIPVQGVYSASKHAVQGFTDALRMELEAAGVPVAVCLVKPGSIDTLLTEHARVHMPRAPKHMPPVYAPDVVAELVVACAVKPRREVYAGGSAKALSLLGRGLPRLTDKVMERRMIEGQMRDEPPRTEGSLDAPSRDGLERSDLYGSAVKERSLYTQASLHPVATGLLLLGAGAAATAWLRSR